METRKHDVLGSRALSTSSQRAYRRSEHATISKDHRDALLQSKRLRLDPRLKDISIASTEEEQQALEIATTNLVSALKQNSIPLSQAARRIRMLVSAGQSDIDVILLNHTLLPAIIRVLLLRQRGRETAEAVLEVVWAITNLAAGTQEVVKKVVVCAPALIAHLSGCLGLPVAEQCAWALGNMAGEDAGICKILAANGAVIPLTRLLLRAASRHEGTSADCEAAAATAAWALCNMLWGDPSQAGHVIEVPQFPKGLVSLLQEDHDEWLYIETAWLLAFLCAGAETHMHTMVKHGAADAVTRRLCSTVGKDGAFDKSLALLTPLLRCVGNMGAFRLAAKSLLSEGCLAAVRLCVRCPNSGLQGEAEWALAMLSKLAQA